MKKNNISRNLPRVTNTGNSTLNMWLTAAEEIIKDIRQRITALEANKSTNSSNSSDSTIKLPNMSDYERTDNRVQLIEKESEGKDKYASVYALKNYVFSMIQSISEQNIFEEWDLVNQTFESLDAKNGDMFKIIGNGLHGAIELRDGDVVEIYDDEDDGLKLLVLIDSRNIMKGVHTTNDLDEGTNHLYFTKLRVLETELESLEESTEEIEDTDTVLISIGKAKGRINHLQQELSFLEFEINQKISDINLDLDGIHLSLESLQNDINIINTKISDNTLSISDLQDDIQNKLNTADLLNELQNTVPANTGTYILKSVDGVVSWVLQP